MPKAQNPFVHIRAQRSLAKPLVTARRLVAVQTTTAAFQLRRTSVAATKVNMAEEDSIDQAVAERRERLRALRAAQELLSTPDDDNNANDENGETNLNMKFRNYVPHDKELQEGKVAPPVLPKFEDPVAAMPPPSETMEDPFVNIAPKKPNWDLRRDVQKKLDKLERRTQKAIYQLMEEQEKQRALAEDVTQPED